MKIREEGFEKKEVCTKLYPSAKSAGKVFRRVSMDGEVEYYACCCVGTNHYQWIGLRSFILWGPPGDPLVGDSITEVEVEVVVRPKGG